jgi:hypothetical protein
MMDGTDRAKIWIAIGVAFVLIGILFAQNAMAQGYIVRDNGEVQRMEPPDRPCPPNNPNCQPPIPPGGDPDKWICRYDCCGNGLIIVDNPRQCRQRDCLYPPYSCDVYPDCSKPDTDPCWSTKCLRQGDFFRD